MFVFYFIIFYFFSKLLFRYWQRDNGLSNVLFLFYFCIFLLIFVSSFTFMFVFCFVFCLKTHFDYTY